MPFFETVDLPARRDQHNLSILLIALLSEAPAEAGKENLLIVTQMDTHRFIGIEPMKGTGGIRPYSNSESHRAEIHQFPSGEKTTLKQFCSHLVACVASGTPFSHGKTGLRQSNCKPASVELFQSDRGQYHGAPVIDDDVQELIVRQVGT